MKALMVVGILLAAAGLFALVYPNIPVGTRQESVQVGPFSSTMETKQYYVVPPVIAALVLAGGVALVVFSKTKK